MSRPYVAVLGPVQVRLGPRLLHVGGPREQKALAALALAAPQVVTADRLAQILWDESIPATAKAQVHNTIARLRRHLTEQTGEPDLIARSGPGYVLRLRDDECDASLFATRERLGNALVERGQLAEALTTLRTALELWRGPALDGLACPALAVQARRLDEQHLACLERRIDLDLALGRHSDVLGELAGLVAEHPLRERLVELQMLALYRCGRRLEALELFHATRDALIEQTGLDPRPELADLHRAILAGEAWLTRYASGVTPEKVETAGEGLLPGLPPRAP